MRTSNIKVIFQTRLEENVISWENHVNEIIDGIENCTGYKYKVYMINPMPITEMDKSAKKLCNSIKCHFGIVTKCYRSEELIASGYIDMLLSATYYIEFN